MTLVSIVVPTHNELPNVEPLWQRISAVFEQMPGLDFELIFVDDSDDATPQRIAELHEKDPRVKLVRMSRRFGQSIAVSAGITRARGDATILMDADLQDPPEAIPQLLELWKQGNEIVYVQRGSSSSYGLYKVFAFCFYRILKKMSTVEIPVDAGEFRLLDRKVVEFLKTLTEHTRYLRGLTVWPGFRQASLQIERAARLQGTTNYNFRRSLLVAVDGVLSFSVVPLRMATLLGICITVFSFLLAIGYIIVRLIHPNLFGSGWASIFVSIFFLGGVQLIVLGIIGEYLGRIFVEVQNRPVYWVDWELGIAPGKEREAGNG
jgi:polyisoprenyl-phosphate glycosyltransferase